MKNPNGYGTIKHLSGARRRPFAFVVTEQGRRRVVSCHATRTEALIAQADYLRRADRPRVKEMTFAELYARWLPVHIARHEVSRSAVNGYRSSFQHCRPLWELPLSKIKYAHVQGVLDAIWSYHFWLLTKGYVNNQNSDGKGYNVVKTYSLTQFVFYGGFDMSMQNFWAAFGR